MNKELSTNIANDYQLTPTDAEIIVGAFKDVVTELSAADEELKAFTIPEDITEMVCKEAKRIRLLYVKARTNGDKIHKKIKAQVLLRSKAIDGTRNIFKLKASERETELKNIEDHFERIETERKADLELERIEILKELEFTSCLGLQLGNMTEEAWTSFHNNVKVQYDARKEAEERERIVYKKAEAEKLELQKQNDKLRKEKEKTQNEIQVKQDLENKRINLEIEERKKKEAELAMQLKAKEDAEEEARIKEENEKKDLESARKTELYQGFLKKNGLTKKNTESGEYIIEGDGKEFIIYKYVDKIIIE